ncbi:XRE family transcriptional regulator [Isoalcanivorax pacificus W11-5]|uniref:XRE family transcriptional regulator n=1 Tax=Isoalcanivorax pacificus W11-5 TaxID=391936 RepID=A0A0B4XHZ3_9GAMM|nr:helix-turn-helix transcriptional regulator [Isoalcanivorax pacificus]AJD46691.1 XRE family transcriptional regulator [Isoalcanivorax pacificus W11-5]
MSEHIEVVTGNAQIIRDNSGNPLYAVVPFDEYQALLDANGRTTIPHEVVVLMIEKDLSPMAAWRKYRGMSQAQMAERLGVTQSAVAQAEKQGNKSHIETLRSWARVLDCEVAQLTD